MAIKTVGIVGAGTMGNGIAQACAVAGLDVVMVDISEAAVQKGIATVAGQHGPADQEGKGHRGRQGGGAGAHPRQHGVRGLSRKPISSSRPPPRTMN